MSDEILPEVHIPGPKGDTGPPGRDGREGRDGQPGQPGKNGRDGKDGGGGVFNAFMTLVAILYLIWFIGGPSLHAQVREFVGTAPVETVGTEDTATCEELKQQVTRVEERLDALSRGVTPTVP